MKIEVGGGIRTTEEVDRVLNIGVNRVIVGTRAIQEPKWLLELTQTQKFQGRIVLGLDASGKLLAIQGWTNAALDLHTAEDLGEISLEDWAKHKLKQLILPGSQPAAIIYDDGGGCAAVEGRRRGRRDHRPGAVRGHPYA
jgi:tRNA-dihydrouridine synthase